MIALHQQCHFSLCGLLMCCVILSWFPIFDFQQTSISCRLHRASLIKIWKYLMDYVEIWVVYCTRNIYSGFNSMKNLRIKSFLIFRMTWQGRLICKCNGNDEDSLCHISYTMIQANIYECLIKSNNINGMWKKSLLYARLNSVALKTNPINLSITPQKRISHLCLFRHKNISSNHHTRRPQQKKKYKFPLINAQSFFKCKIQPWLLRWKIVSENFRNPLNVLAVDDDKISFPRVYIFITVLHRVLFISLVNKWGAVVAKIKGKSKTQQNWSLH